jgi:hypothetical protein
MKTKELGWKETQGIQNIGIEDSHGNRIVDQRQVLKIWENYITELYDRPNRPETLEGYSHLKAEALDRIKWRNRFGRGFGQTVTCLHTNRPGHI